MLIAQEERLKKLKENRTKIYKRILGSNQGVGCLDCIRDINAYKISVRNPKYTNTMPVCVCQLHKYLDGKNEVLIDGVRWNYEHASYEPAVEELFNLGILGERMYPILTP